MFCMSPYTSTQAYTNPIFVGTLSKNAIKTKNCNLVNHLKLYLIDKSTDKTFPVFLQTNLIVFCKYKQTTECDTCNTQKSWDKTRLKRLQVTLFLKVPQLSVKLVTGEVIKIEDIRSMQERMGPGSPLCAKLRERIVRQFKENFSQPKIAKN